MTVEFPFQTKHNSHQINNQKTDFIFTNYKNKIQLFITNKEALGTMFLLTRESTLIQDLASPILKTTNLLGVPSLFQSVVANHVYSLIIEKDKDELRPLLFSICLNHVDDSDLPLQRCILKEITHVLNLII